MKEMLITSSVLILAFLLLRFLFRSTISRRVQYALWLLVALRLLVPVSIGNSGWSVAAMAGQLPEREISENILAVVGGDAPDLAPREPDPSLPEAEQRVLYQAYQQEWKDAVERAKIESGGTPITVQSILRIVWFIGMAVMALWFLAANLRFARKLRRTRVPLDDVVSKYPIFLCDDIPSPCLFGLFRPTIYVTSAAAKDENRLRCVIAHEETHARHLDPLWSLVRSVCLAVWWFNPLVWLAAYCSRADCELACDEGVLARLGESERVPYGETLLSLVPVRRGGDPMLAATTMTAGKRQMKERIQRIAEHKRPLAVALVAVLALTGIVCAATFTGTERNESEAAEPIAVTATSLSDALRENWARWDAMDRSAQMLSSALPGHCTREMETWTEGTVLLGITPWNPLEEADWLKSRNYTGSEAERRHAYLSWSGERDGTVTYASLQAGYADGDVRVTLMAEPFSRLTDWAQASDGVHYDSGALYDAAECYFDRDGCHYTARIVSQSGKAALEETLARVRELLAGKIIQPTVRDDPRALLDSVCGADGAGEPITLRLYSAYGESAVESVGDEDARASGNFRFFMNYLFRSTDVSFEPAELPALDENTIELTIQSTGDRLRFWVGDKSIVDRPRRHAAVLPCGLCRRGHRRGRFDA